MNKTIIPFLSLKLFVLLTLTMLLTAQNALAQQTLDSIQDQLDDILAQTEFVAVTEKTASSALALRSQLSEDKSIGVAWSVGNFEAGIGSSAAALFDNTGEVAGAINVTGPEKEFQKSSGRRGEIFSALTRAADRISHQLGFYPQKALNSQF